MKLATDIRIVIVAYGSFGDIYPQLGIAVQLRNCGHRVLFAANEYFRDAIHRAGIDYAQAGTRAEQLAARETADSSGDTFEGAMVRYDHLIGRNYSRVGQIIESLMRDGERVLVVTHGHLSPAFPICEQLDVPIVMTYYAPSQIPDNREDYVLYRASFGASEWFARHIRYPLHRIKSRIHETPYGNYREWRRKAGYQPIGSPLQLLLIHMLRHGPSARIAHPNVVRQIALFPQWFADPVGADLGNLEFAGFVFHADERPDNQRIVDDFIARHGAPIVFTPGTAVEDAAAFCRVIPQTCRSMNAPALVLSRYADSAVLADGGPAVPMLTLDHVDLGYVLPRARLLVHHGGVGTLAQAVRAGIPQIIRPRMYDQPSNALRVTLNGLGGMLYEDGYDPSAIAAVYSHLTTSELHRERLAWFGEQTRSQDGAVNAAQAIAECAREQHAPARTRADVTNAQLLDPVA